MCFNWISLYYILVTAVWINIMCLQTSSSSGGVVKNTFSVKYKVQKSKIARNAINFQG